MKTTFKLMALATLLSVSFIDNAWSVDDDALPPSAQEELGQKSVTDCTAISQSTTDVSADPSQPAGSQTTPSSTDKGQ